MKRRDFVKSSGGATAALMLLGPLGCRGANPHGRPFLYLTRGSGAATRSIAELRASISSGHGRVLWNAIQHEAVEDVGAEVVMPDSEIPGRSPATIAARNLDFLVCDAAGQRMKRLALVHIVTGESAYLEAAVAQMDAILDPALWPDWIDQAHLRFGHPAGLRTGMLAYDSGLTYDWLFESLTVDERARLAQGIERRGIEPLRVSLRQDPWWMRDLNNWTTTIVGGVAVAAMALGDQIDDTDAIVDVAAATFERYLAIYGANGEFNESPAYANATLRPVEFFRALDDWRGSGSARLSKHPFPETCTWLRYMTLPSGHTAAFGDSHVDAKPWTKYVAAVAAATRDPSLQQFYLDHSGSGDAVELIWFDAGLAPESSTRSLPLGRHFPEHGGCFCVRESWANDADQFVVYGKSGREENHEHNDAGQLCIDVSGERMIVDLGSPSGYPEDFFEAQRWNYYNASVIGHNVLQFDQREMRIPDWTRGDGRPQGIDDITGRMVAAEFSDDWGARLLMDTTNSYDGVTSVRRAVIVLRPGIVAVLDRAELPEAEDVTLRWHTINRSTPEADGHFIVAGQDARLACWLGSAGDGAQPKLSRREHSYAAPYNLSRTGEPLEARKESYVEATTRAKSVAWLTVFAAIEPAAPARRWSMRDGVVSIESGRRTVSVWFDGTTLRVSDGSTVRMQDVTVD